MKRKVTEADLRPYGWICEGCARYFRVGDTATSVVVSIDTDGSRIHHDWRCDTCLKRKAVA